MKRLGVFSIFLTSILIEIAFGNPPEPSCVFPFKYQGQVYENKCTTDHFDAPWCATGVDNFNEMIDWKYCPVPISQCKFPFRYLGIDYHNCTTTELGFPWCATGVDLSGSPLKWAKCSNEQSSMNNNNQEKGSNGDFNIECGYPIGDPDLPNNFDFKSPLNCQLVDRETKGFVDLDRYYSVDGSCNNMQVPHWGRVGINYRRIVPSRYSDGFNKPRSSSSVPTPTQLSDALFSLRANSKDEDPFHNSFLMTFGQLVAHETSLIEKDTDNGERFDIQDQIKPPMRFVRSTNNCNKHGYIREQSNSRTSFVDGSVIYGSSRVVAKELRLLRDGLLKSEPDESTEIEFSKLFGLGRHSPHEKCLPRNRSDSFHYVAGDDRVKESSTLTTLQSLLKNEHNRLAKLFRSRTNLLVHFEKYYSNKYNKSPYQDNSWYNQRVKGLGKFFNATTSKTLKPPPMSKQVRDEYLIFIDEFIYQNVRKIMIATFQKLVYEDYLPTILGPEIMNIFDLSSKSSYSYYDEKVNPSIFNAFTIAFRFGHSQIATAIRGRPFSSNLVNQTSILSKKDLNDFLVQDLRINAEKVNLIFTNDIRTNLPAESSDGGFNLPAINVQRERDHGLGYYSDYRRVCGLSPLNPKHPPKEISPDYWPLLMKLYNGDPSKIDMYVGGLSEIHNPGSVLGPTFACLIAYQFHLIKFGDKKFYSHEFGGKNRRIDSSSDFRYINSLKSRKRHDDISLVSNGFLSRDNHAITEDKTISRKDAFKSFGNNINLSIRKTREIEKRSLQQIICDNSNLALVPSKIFEVIHPGNPWISCKYIEPYNPSDFSFTYDETFLG